MTGSLPAEVVYNRIEEALRLLQCAPVSPTLRTIERALLVARGRVQRLEQRLGETETMRDRIAMQLLPSALACHTEQGDRSDSGSIRRAYELADEVLAVRRQGSAGAPGETTSSKFQEYVIGDKLKLRGETATITDAELDDEGVWRYDWSFQGGGSEGNFSAAEIAEIRARA